MFYYFFNLCYSAEYKVILPTKSMEIKYSSHVLEVGDFFLIDLDDYKQNSLSKDNNFITAINFEYDIEKNNVTCYYYENETEYYNQNSFNIKQNCTGFIKKGFGIFKIVNEGKEKITNCSLGTGLIISNSSSSETLVFNQRKNDIFTVKTQEYLNEISSGYDLSTYYDNQLIYMSLLSPNSNVTYEIKYGSLKSQNVPNIKDYSTVLIDNKKTSNSNNIYTNSPLVLHTLFKENTIDAIQITIKSQSEDEKYGDKIVFSPHTSLYYFNSNKNSYSKYPLYKDPNYPPTKRDENKFFSFIEHSKELFLLIYFGLGVISYILLIIIAAIHPNRWYRIGFRCNCLNCCCHKKIEKSRVFYSEHPVKQDILATFCCCLPASKRTRTIEADNPNIWGCNNNDYSFMFLIYIVIGGMFIFALCASPVINFLIILMLCRVNDDEEAVFECKLRNNEDYSISQVMEPQTKDTINQTLYDEEKPKQKSKRKHKNKSSSKQEIEYPQTSQFNNNYNKNNQQNNNYELDEFPNPYTMN